MRISKVRLVTGLLLCLGSPLAADWQFTRWGMSETELIVAAPNVVRDQGGFLGSNIKIGDLELTAQYTFRVEGSATRLSEVILRPRRGSDCSEIIQLLRLKYGPNYTTRGISGHTGAAIVTWMDEASGNKIELAWTSTWEIVYLPLDTDPRNGL